MIVDDDPQVLTGFTRMLTAEGHSVVSAGSGEEACSLLAGNDADLVVMDIRLPGISGLETLQNMHRTATKLPVIIMTAFGTTETAIEATKNGAFDYILKPFHIPDMLGLIEQALEAGKFMRAPVALDTRATDPTAEAIIGKSPQMQEVYKAIGRAAPTDTTVLIRGESGTGKELAARALYQHSLRAEKPFLVINCVAIPETLLEAELFGYEKGSFTGAFRKRIGKVEQAHGGTLFLDEIGDMPLGIQSKILRLLQEQTIERIGTEQEVQADVRIIAATNRTLERRIEAGLFREDLYYRLNVVSIRMPPLREHSEDIPLLCSYFLEQFSHALGIDNPGIQGDTLALLSGHTWPGNVRELANVLQKALIFSRGMPLSCSDVSDGIAHSANTQAVQNSEREIRGWVHQFLRSHNNGSLFSDLNDRFTAIVIQEILDLCRGNQSQAAKLLGLSRPTLQARIEKYGLTTMRAK